MQQAAAFLFSKPCKPIAVRLASKGGKKWYDGIYWQHPLVKTVKS